MSYRFQRVGAALRTGLLPLARFDALPAEDQAEIVEYLHECDLMAAYEMQQQEDEMRRAANRK